jgi:hypothetical protein
MPIFLVDWSGTPSFLFDAKPHGIYRRSHLLIIVVTGNVTAIIFGGRWLVLLIASAI